VGEKTIHDIYYDTADLSLTKQDAWLRNRNGAWELKLALHVLGMANRFADGYREVEKEKEILLELKLTGKGTLPEQIQRSGYEPVIDIITTRKTYGKEGFTIVLDVMDFGYEIAEIEQMVNDKSEMEAAGQRIMDFASQHGLGLGPVPGKVTEYCRRHRPQHYATLVSAGII